MINFYDQIGDFLAGRLSEVNQRRFEEALKNDKDLFVAVHNHNLNQNLLDFLVEEDIRSVVDKLKSTSVETNKSSTKGKFWLGLLIGVLIVIGVLYFLRSSDKKQKSSPQEIYAQLYSPYIQAGSRGTSAATLEELSICDQGHYLMERKQIERARDLFENSERDPACLQKIQWYLTMCYLYLDEENKRDSLLQVVMNNPQHDYMDKAQRLEKALSK